MSGVTEERWTRLAAALQARPWHRGQIEQRRFVGGCPDEVAAAMAAAAVEMDPDWRT